MQKVSKIQTVADEYVRLRDSINADSAKLAELRVTMNKATMKEGKKSKDGKTFTAVFGDKEFILSLCVPARVLDIEKAAKLIPKSRLVACYTIDPDKVARLVELKLISQKTFLKMLKPSDKQPYYRLEVSKIK